MDTPGIHKEKRKVREELRGRLAGLTSDERESWSSAIRKVLAERAGDRAVVAYMPLASEPDITPFLRGLWNAGKTVGLPRVVGSELVVHWVVHEEQLVCGSFGLREPSSELPVWQPGREPALCLVPGLAFDREGHRLGRGRGYYDRFLSRHGKELERVGVYFACQQLGVVPREAHDQTLDGWVTENGFGAPQGP
jgi:5-formyltetrahydrofolate cyclo-ligase